MILSRCNVIIPFFCLLVRPCLLCSVPEHTRIEAVLPRGPQEVYLPNEQNYHNDVLKYCWLINSSFLQKKKKIRARIMSNNGT